jgi:ferredoxin
MPYHLEVHNPATGDHWTLWVSPEERILAQAEAQGIPLPFSCAHGICTTCAAKIIHGEVAQPHAFGISQELKDQGYALLCVSYPRSDLRVELQDEDEVYDLQFGSSFPKNPREAQPGLPLDLE